MTKINHVLIRARRQIVNDRIGNNRSMFRGEGYDFSELREYTAGDDIRHIDWNITAKLQRPYVKVFHEERELNIVTVAMLGGSLLFGSGKSKLESLAEAVAVVGYSALGNNDLFSHYTFLEDTFDEVRASKKRFAIHSSVEQILSHPLIGKRADVTQMEKVLYSRLKRKSLIVVIGDFFEIPDLRLLARKHEVVALIVRDKEEEKPSLNGYATLQDPQTGQILEGNFSDRNAKTYHRKVVEHDVALFEKFRHDGIRAVKLYTHTPAQVTLRRLFEGK